MSRPMDAVVLEEPLNPAWYSPLAAPVSRWHRNVLRLKTMPMSEQVIVYHMTAVGDPPVVLVKNSKAGCTTLVQTMYFSRTGRFYEGRVHEEHEVLTQGEMDWPETLARARAMRRFLVTSVRDPRDRAYSAFRDFFLDKKNPSTNRHMGGLVAFGLDLEKGEDFNFSVFLDYVEASLERDRYLTDRHWREQSVNTAIKTIKYDLVVRVERFTETLGPLMDALKIPHAQRDVILEAQFNKSARRFDVAKHHQRRIEKIYRADMEAFSY